ncbi:polyprenyl synthetase, partial [Listeria ivanovii FSL F6-596]
KPVLNDMKQGIYSLPLIYAMKGHLSEFEPLLAQKLDMTDAASEQVLALISKYNGVEQAFKLANKYTNKALREIKKLPATTYRDDMYRLTKSILDRDI